MEPNASAERPPQLTLVLLPGLDGTGCLFKALLAALPSGLNPLVISLPQDGDQSYAALATYVTGLLPAAAPFVLLGESFSGPLALRVAAGCGKNLTAVILVASRMAQRSAWLPPRCLMRPFVVRMGIRLLPLGWLLMGNSPPSQLIRCTREILRSIDPVTLIGRAKAAAAIDAAELLVRCQVPILYLAAKQDRLVPSQTVARLQRLRPDLTCVAIDAPHFLLQRNPVEAARAISAFVFSLVRPSPVE